jgi:hypothetical protein
MLKQEADIQEAAAAWRRLVLAGASAGNPDVSAWPTQEVSDSMWATSGRSSGSTRRRPKQPGAVRDRTASWPVTDVGEGVLDRNAFMQFRAAVRVLLALRSSASSASSGWMDTLSPWLLAVQRACSRQPAQAPSGERTVLPGSNGMLTPAGPVSCPTANWILDAAGSFPANGDAQATTAAIAARAGVSEALLFAAAESPRDLHRPGIRPARAAARLW